MLTLLWLTSWLWLSVPCLAVLLGLVLLFVGGKSIERSRAAGGGIAGIGLVMVVLGVPFTGLYLTNSIAKQRHEKETRQANEEVASVVKAAQESFDKGDLDKAETELQRVPLVVKATDTKAAGLLQEKIGVRVRKPQSEKPTETLWNWSGKLKWIFLPVDWKPRKRNCLGHCQSRLQLTRRRPTSFLANFPLDARNSPTRKLQSSSPTPRIRSGLLSTIKRCK